MDTQIQREAVLAQHQELRPGEAAAGIVCRLPEHGTYRGNSLLLRLDDGALIALEATAKRGYAGLARELERLHVQPGDHIRIAFTEWRRAASGYTYRHFTVETVDGAA